MTEAILVINPNSTAACTEAIDQALDPLRAPDGPEIDCLTLAEGPPGVETQRHADQVIAPLCRLIERHDNRAGAFVIACFSDPGLHAARETTAKPVLGIAESGLLTAMTLGERVGIVSILGAAIPRHRRLIRALGIESRIAGDLALGLGVVALADEARSWPRLVEVGAALRDEHGAEVLVLGCAGMARFRRRLEDALDLPVIDPSQAAVGMAISALRLGYRAAVQR